MTAPYVPPPVPRRTRKLPVVGMVVASAFGLGLFWFLWDVAVELQQRVVPTRQAGTYEAPSVTGSSAAP
ncbi:MAG: hypothetical protein AB2A00_39610 [Myxococcota bacterium]